MNDRISGFAALLKAMGDVKRLKIVKMLASSMEESLCVSDVAVKLGITQPAASQHIKILKSIGILRENRKGFRVYYTIDSDTLIAWKKEMDRFFQKAFEPCPHGLTCRECSFNRGCGE